MAGDSRALTLKLLADIDNFSKNINKADNEVTTFGDKISKFGKAVGKAFLIAGAAAAAYAGKLAIDGVKSAIEDEKAQAKLALTLKNVAGATDAAVAQTEAYVLQTSLAFGVTDDDLRPSLERLARATGDVTKAQNLQRIALDVAAGSGKSLEAVSNALGKAYEGNTGALGKLGIGLSSAELKTLSFDEITQKLAGTFANQATVQAETFEGKMARLRVSFDEAKETLGTALLPKLTELVDFITANILPAFDSFIAGITGEAGLNSGLTKTQKLAFQLGQTISTMGSRLGAVFALLSTDGKSSFEGFLTVLNAIAKVANTVVTIIREAASVIIEMANAAINAKNALLPGADTRLIPQIPGTVFAPKSSKALPGVMSGSSVGAGNINLTVNGAIDPEGTARTIVNVLNQSSYRGTLGAAGFVN
jgi:hypothetical protein